VPIRSASDSPAAGPAGGGTGGSLFRTVGPFVPLAIALLVGGGGLPGIRSNAPSALAAANTTDPAQCDDVASVTDCHTRFPTGCSAAARYDAFVNFLKDKLNPPAPDSTFRFYTNLPDFQTLDAAVPDGLTKSNHGDFKDVLSRLGEGQIRGVAGFLYYAIQTGAESSNCELTGDDEVDYHIGIGFDAALAGRVLKAAAGPHRLTKTDAKAIKQQSMIVEITPHYRAFKQPNWTLDAVKSALGRQVRIMGALLLDSEHIKPSDSCAVAGADMEKCWRGSTWELHPVTRFQVCRTGTCTEQTGDWVDLENLDEATTPPGAPGRP
jgi:hypothetical protein